jgi:cobyrinic acid a,c-diamide synthase
MNSSVKYSRRGIAVGGIRGGSGKTLFSVGLIQALKRRGVNVAPFKKGPDYIDPAWLSLSAGTQCLNLDAYLMPKEKILSSFLGGSRGPGFAVVEGNRGLFDGLDIDGTYSFAELVKWLNIPLLIVLDCSKSSRTLAALVHGLETFDPKLPLSGVVLNQIAGERHKKIITESIEKYCRTPVLGALPRLTDLPLNERHLGLVPVGEHPDPDGVIATLGDMVEHNADIEAILKLTETVQETEAAGFPETPHTYDSIIENRGYVEKSGPDGPDTQENERSVQPAIGVIRDSAFNFYYAENLAALEKNGARIIELNSISDEDIPPVDGLYIGGGFPETHVELLSKNHRFREKIQKLVNAGLPVYAECGGLIYLSDSIAINGRYFPMAGIFPFIFEISDRPVGHGYTLFEVDRENPFYRTGVVVRGHEFRYSRIVNAGEADKVNMVFTMRRGAGIAGGRDGILYNNCLATFSHTHAYGENIQWIESMRTLAMYEMQKKGAGSGFLLS